MEIAIDKVDISGRSRKTFGDVQSLAESIERVGLLHPIVITADNKLVAGRRRIEAFRLLGRTVIPAYVAHDIDELRLLLEAERDENTCRVGYTPEEAVALGRRLAPLLEKLTREAEREGGRAGGKKSRKREADEVKGGANCPTLTRDESKRRNAMAAEAAGMARKSYEKAAEVVASKNRDLIDEMNATGKVDPAYRRLKAEQKRQEIAAKAEGLRGGGAAVPWEIHHADCVDDLPELRDRARLVFADPPYNLGVDYGPGEQADRLSDADYLTWCSQWIGLCVDALVDDGTLWVMICDEWAWQFGRILAEDYGMCIRAWVKWYETFGVNRAKNFNRTSRHLFYCVKDPSRFVFNAVWVNRPSDRQTKYNDARAESAGKNWDDVWQIPRLTGTCKERIPSFPTQLPLAMLRGIVGACSDPGDVVVDPFSGSGTTGVASIELGRRFVGMEKEKPFWELARTRLDGTRFVSAVPSASALDNDSSVDDAAAK